MELNLFKTRMREKRWELFPSPSNLTLQNFRALQFNQQDIQYFFNNASAIIENLRQLNWDSFVALENSFSSEMYQLLIDEDAIQDLSTVEGINWFFTNFPEHIYALNLSNTQSRRSRAGKEFEFIIELILAGAGIPFDTQGSVASGVFETENLAKLVDCVSPGALEYRVNKRNTSLISAKTTLRERWQEVGDEMSRTQAREMYLVTLDNGVSGNTINLLNQNNIVLVTTERIKNEYYKANDHVLSFESMLLELSNKAEVWDNYPYNENQYQQKMTQLIHLRDTSNDDFFTSYYTRLIQKLENQVR